MFELIRHNIDKISEFGLYILTGSSTPTESNIRHDGAGRFDEIKLSTLTLQEMGRNEKIFSFQNLFLGKQITTFGDIDSSMHEKSVEKNISYLCMGGFPTNVTFDEKQCIKKNVAYLNLIANSYLLDDENSIFSFNNLTMINVIKALSKRIMREINYDAIASECKIDHRTCKKYLNILQNMNI